VFLLCLCCNSCLGNFQWFQILPNTPAPQSPTARYHHIFSAIGNSSGVLQGGFNLATGSFLSDTWLYLPDIKSWKQVPASPEALSRAYHAADTYENSVIIHGGDSPAGVLNDIWRYDSDKNTWTQDVYSNVPAGVAPLLFRQYHEGVVVGTKFYLFGGHTASLGRTSNDLLAYDLTTRQWAVVVPDGTPGNPPARQGHSLSYYKDKKLGDVLIVVGGYSDKPYTGGYNDTWRYVITNNKWQEIISTAKPEGRYGHDAAVAGDTLLLYGGITTFNTENPPTYDVFYSDVWGLDLDAENPQWTLIIPNDDPTGPGARQGQQVAVLNGYFTNVGGYIQYFGVVNDVYYLIDVDDKTK